MGEYSKIVKKYLVRKYGKAEIPDGKTPTDLAKEILTEAICNTTFDKPERRDELLEIVNGFEDN